MTRFTHSSHPTPSVPSGERTPRAPAPAGDPEVEAIRRLTDRRGLLKAVGLGVGIVTGAGVLAACSSPPVQPDPSAKSPAAPASSGPPASAAPTGGGLPTSEIPVGGGMVFLATKTVVTQPTAGTFKAFDSTCPHQGCNVAKVADGKIDCPCHGSQFDISTGDMVTGPAVTGLTPKTITVTGGTFAVT